MEKDKRGNLLLTMNVMGTGISARVDITLYKGSNEASVTITPNFNSNRMTLSGQIVPIEKSKYLKDVPSDGGHLSDNFRTGYEPVNDKEKEV